MYRTVDIRLWTDPKVHSLPPREKLLFLYLLTNPHTDLSGLYYLPLSLVIYETGLTRQVICKGIDTLSDRTLIRYDRQTDTIWVVNMLRYQSKSKKITQHVATHFAGIHKSPLIQDFLDHYKDLTIPYKYHNDTVTIPNRYKEQEQYQDKEQDKDKKHTQLSTDKIDEANRVIDYLNSAANTRFRHSPQSQKHILARLRDKGTVEGCYLIIDHKLKWLQDPNMAEYLRPTTLFSPGHFEEYLAAAIRWNDHGRERTEKEKLARNKAIARAGSELYDEETPEIGGRDGKETRD